MITHYINKITIINYKENKVSQIHVENKLISGGEQKLFLTQNDNY